MTLPMVGSSLKHGIATSLRLGISSIISISDLLLSESIFLSINEKSSCFSLFNFSVSLPYAIPKPLP